SWRSCLSNVLFVCWDCHKRYEGHPEPEGPVSLGWPHFAHARRDPLLRGVRPALPPPRGGIVCLPDPRGRGVGCGAPGGAWSINAHPSRRVGLGAEPTHRPAKITDPRPRSISNSSSLIDAGFTRNSSLSRNCTCLPFASRTLRNTGVWPRYRFSTSPTA